MTASKQQQQQQQQQEQQEQQEQQQQQQQQHNMSQDAVSGVRERLTPFNCMVVSITDYYFV
jgi:hypothetical protein